MATDNDSHTNCSFAAHLTCLRTHQSSLPSQYKQNKIETEKHYQNTDTVDYIDYVREAIPCTKSRANMSTKGL